MRLSAGPLSVREASPWLIDLQRVGRQERPGLESVMARRLAAEGLQTSLAV
jgi:hypothetical protein